MNRETKMEIGIRRAVLAAFILVLLIGGCDLFKSPTSSEDSLETKLQAIQAQIDEWVESGQIVGAEIQLIKSGETIYHDVSGWRDVDRQLPVEPNTICRIRSMTKPIVGTAIFMLWEEGLLDLDDRVSDYIPAFDNDACRDITIEQLLQHTGGFRQPGYPGWAGDYTSLQAIIDALAEAGPTYPPGQYFSYSDGGSSTLAAVVTAVSGMPAEDFIQTRLFDPLNMADSFCILDEGDPRRPRISCTYLIDQGTGTWVEYWDNYDPPKVPFFRGSGGVFSTTSDYARFIGMWMNGGEWENRRYLQNTTVDRALTPSPQSMAVNRPYGYHWQKYNAGVFGHGGSDGTWAYASQTDDFVVLYFTQSRGNRTLGDIPTLVYDAISD